MNKREEGQKIEMLVSIYLWTLGFRLVETNFYSKSGELDLIVQSKVTSEYVVVEVKSLKQRFFENIYQTLSRIKLLKLRRTCQEWQAKRSLNDLPLNLAFVGVVVDGRTYKINYLEAI